MPFTPAHVAAVLPFVRTPLVSSALVAGSMAPDFPYYLQLPMRRGTTHSLSAVFGYDAFLGASALLLWYGLLLAPLSVAVPAAVRARWHPARPRITFRWVMVAYASLCVGGLTHICWDAFTHAHAWGTERVGWLQSPFYGVNGYLWAQYASGLFGAVVMAWWLWRWWQRTPAGEARPGLRHWWVPWVLVGGVTCSAGAGAAVASLAQGHGLRGIGFIAATAGLGSGGLVALLLAVGWRVVAVASGPDVEDEFADRPS